MNIPKVSVIVLIYKVEKYIERCARSLFCTGHRTKRIKRYIE